MLDGIKDSFRMLPPTAVEEEIDCGHGRVERRKCSVIAELTLLEKASEWTSLQGLVRIQAERFHKASGKTERETRYYITSLKPDAMRLNRAIRQHWGENKLHWVLDIAFAEDLNRKRTGHAAQNFSLSRQIKNLETNLGVMLFERTHSGVKLTPREMISCPMRGRQFTKLNLQLQPRWPINNQISLAHSPHTDPNLLTRVLSDLEKASPGLSISTHSLRATSSLNALGSVKWMRAWRFFH